MFNRLTKQGSIGIGIFFPVIIALTLLLLGAILTGYNISIQNKILRDELKNRGTLLVKNLARSSVFSFLSNDIRQMRELTRSASRDTEILYAEILGLDGEPVAGSGIGGNIPVWDKKQLLELQDVQEVYRKEKKLFDIYYPILVKGGNDQESKEILLGRALPDNAESIERMIGLARVGISTTSIRTKISSIAFKGLILTLCLVLCGGLTINYFINNQIVQPLRRLTLAAVTVSHGDLRQEVDIATDNEIGVLAKAFNMMVHELRDFRTKLEQTIYKLEDRVKERTKDLETHIQELQEQIRYLNDLNRRTVTFITTALRELRSPLTSIHGFTSTLLSGSVKQDSEKSASYLRIIGEESDRMSKLIANLGDLLEIQSDTFAIRFKEVNCKQVIDRIISEMQEKFPDITFKKEIHESLTPVKADEERLAQVLTELLFNAAKYSPRNGKVVLECEVSDQTVSFKVRDSGPGIPDDEKEKVFQHFYRLDNESNKKYPGSGLGLTIAHAIVSAHGGKLCIEDAPGGGSLIIVKLNIDPNIDTP